MLVEKQYWVNISPVANILDKIGMTFCSKIEVYIFSISLKYIQELFRYYLANIFNLKPTFLQYGFFIANIFNS